jgi:uncharacterized membrane protein
LSAYARDRLGQSRPHPMISQQTLCPPEVSISIAIHTADGISKGSGMVCAYAWASPPLETCRSMSTITPTYRSRFATAIFDLLNPIPYGLFVGALIFDVTYATTRNVFWGKGAAWLVTVALFFAIIPRLINLCHVWFAPSRFPATGIEKLDFWLNLLGIIAAIVNAFVHSRDAYAMVPLNVILSIVTVALLSIGHIAIAVDKAGFKEVVHE